jgi:hypothetical protein
MSDTCDLCGAKRGVWHMSDCKYRVGAPWDEFLCQHIGLPTHEAEFQKYQNWIPPVFAYASDENGTNFSLEFDVNLEYVAAMVPTNEWFKSHPDGLIAESDFAGKWKHYAGVKKQ